VRPKRLWLINEITAVPIRIWIDKNSCWYAYEYDPVAGIILPPEWPVAGTVLLPELISSAPICLWNYDLLTRPRADMPVSLNLSLVPYCYYNRPLLPCLQLTNPCCFISSWLTLTALPTANQLLLLLPTAILTPCCLFIVPKVQKEELPEGTGWYYWRVYLINSC
jgi:hypothetical protein